MVFSERGCAYAGFEEIYKKEKHFSFRMPTGFIWYQKPGFQCSLCELSSPLRLLTFLKCSNILLIDNSEKLIANDREIALF